MDVTNSAAKVFERCFDTFAVEAVRVIYVPQHAAVALFDKIAQQFRVAKDAVRFDKRQDVFAACVT